MPPGDCCVTVSWTVTSLRYSIGGWISRGTLDDVSVKSTEDVSSETPTFESTSCCAPRLNLVRFRKNNTGKGSRGKVPLRLNVTTWGIDDVKAGYTQSAQCKYRLTVLLRFKANLQPVRVQLRKLTHKKRVMITGFPQGRHSTRIQVVFGKYLIEHAQRQRLRCRVSMRRSERPGRIATFCVG